MSRYFNLLTAALVAALALPASVAVAADNSGIVIIDQRHRTTPYGQYHSERRTQVFGPASGYRYEEYQRRTPAVVVYPDTGSHGYGYSDPGRSDGRVIQRPGPGAYGAYGAATVTPAPRVGGYANPYRGENRRFHHDRRDSRGLREHADRRSWQYGSPGFGRDPSQRAIEPAQRAIQPSRRAIGH